MLGVVALEFGEGLLVGGEEIAATPGYGHRCAARGGDVEVGGRRRLDAHAGRVGLVQALELLHVGNLNIGMRFENLVEAVELGGEGLGALLTKAAIFWRSSSERLPTAG